MAGVSLTLSQTKPDFESLVVQLQLFLNSRGTWKDLLTSSTGQTLIEMMASVGTFNQFAIEMAAREGFLEQAVRASSIYAIVRMLGVRISRKLPAQGDVSITRTGDLTFQLMVPKFTQWTINGRFFFNRYPVVFSAGTSTLDNVTLYEGQIKQQTIAADSSTFREIYLNVPGFNVSDQDIQVQLINPTTGIAETWSAIDGGIWTAEPTDKVYYDSTDGYGDAVLAFGDGHSGYLPALGNNIVVTYAYTVGSLGNVGTSGLEVQCSSYPAITGHTTSQITGGADEKAPDYYRTTAPHIYKARGRAITPVDYRAIATSYPGIASAAIQTQKDIAPNDLRWMNTVRLCLLPENSDYLTPEQWDDFEAWFRAKNHVSIPIQRFNPEKEVCDVEIVLFLKSAGRAEVIVPQAEENIRKLFVKDKKTLGRRVARSDIDGAARGELVDYVQIISPADDLVVLDENGRPNVLKYFSLGTLKVTPRYSER